MRLHFQEKPLDLYVAVAYTVVTSATLLAFDEGNLLAIFLVIFVPGYLSVATIFPGSTVGGKPEIDWIERIGLSFGLSLAIVPLLSIFLNFSPWGIRFAPTILAITLFTVGASPVAYWRRMRLPTEQRLSLTLDFAMNEWHEYGRLDKALTIALTVSILIAGGTLGYLVLAPQAQETFTELYLLGPDGSASGYPTTLNVSQTGTVILGIANHEAATVNYAVRADLVGIRIAYNATVGHNETLEVNRTTKSWINATLSNGQNWTQSYLFSVGFAGFWKLQFLLYKNDISTNQEIHLYIRVA